MGILIKHNKSTKVIPIKRVGCRASKISSILPSGSWKDRTCFLLGGGPSLKDFNFDVIKDELTIGVNKSFIKFPTTILYAMDQRFYDLVTFAGNTKCEMPQQKELHQQWLAYKGIKLFVRRSPKLRFDESVYIVNSLSKKAVSFDLDEGIWEGNNSGFGALMLAIALGATRIGLLGYDLKVQKDRKIVTHWHGGYGLGDEKNFQSKLDKFIKCFEEFAPAIAQQQDIEVVNLVEKSEDSNLNCFPKDSLENFLKKSDM